MTTSGSRPLNSTENTFSYAAAASGKNSTGPTTRSQSATSKNPVVSSNGSAGTQHPVSASSSTAHSMNGGTAPTIRTSTPHSVAMPDSYLKRGSDMRAAPPAASVPSPGLGTSSSVVSKEDDSLSAILSVPEDKANSWEKQSQTSSHADNKSSSGSRTPDVHRGGDLIPASIPPVNPWKVRSESIARKPPFPAPAIPALPKSMAGPNAASAKASSEGLAERGVVAGKEVPANDPSEVHDRGKGEELSSTTGDWKDAQAKDRRKGGEAAKVNGFVGMDGGVPRKSGKKGQQEKELTAPVLPPPVTDTESWPTPETAQDGAEKYKKERADKDRPNAPVARGNKVWVAAAEIVPEYVQPYKAPRGGRSNRSIREGGGRGAGASYQAGERNTYGSENERGRQGAGVSAARGGYQGGKGGKRATSAGGTPQRRDSKVALPTATSERKREFVKDGVEPDSGPGQSVKPSGAQGDGLPSGSGAKAADQPNEGQDRNYQNGQNLHHNSGERVPYRSFNNRSDYSTAEGGSSHPPRERGMEPRGRGGHRGRNGSFYGSQYSNNHHNGGHHAGSGSYNSTPQNFHPGHTNGQYSSQNPQASGRSYRGSSRAHSLPNTAVYNRFPNPHMQSPPFVPFQVPYGFEMVPPGEAPMVGIAFPPLPEITNQINYYFSVDNLCKDMYLRKHMDNEGFVALSFIANFNRVRGLTQDPNMLRDACMQSQDLFLIPGPDDWYLRKAEGWEKWTLAEEEREPSARGSRALACGDPRLLGLQNGVPGEMSGSAPPFNPDPRRNRSLGTIAVGAPPFIPSGGVYPQSAGGMGNYGTLLSAEVPEFSPSFANMNGLSNVFVPQHVDQEFPDSDVDQLIIVVKRPAGDSKPSSPVASPSKPRSNGIVSPTLTNGDMSGHDSSMVSPSSAVFPGNSGDRSMNAQGDVGWLLSQDVQGSTETPNTPPKKLVHRSYGKFLSQTVSQRKESTKPTKNSDMATLYRFWSHFLPQKFNGRMYSDFRKYALEDANHSLRSGLESLFNFYESSLNYRESISENLVQDFVRLAKVDGKNGFEYGPQKLKAVLGNDGLKLHHRQSIEELLDAEVNGFLEGGVEKKDGQLAELYTITFAV
ncbi:unnamed protein product [Tuber melanosporum]|uniref:(Perigord truffle) hypothetical protein n=1 Tax=Tuber melanosporum (strain Mel28) TaxID=656061 RepID=D5G9F6_TUBMM|nr:uncharacterized protein GSTUM_00003290001 [Tuber melanosporum]CAZ81149.1 unnamed protein product [Tuber melanosporum]